MISDRELNGALRLLREAGPRYAGEGICINVANMLGVRPSADVYNRLEVLVRKWPEFSGNKEYPVPALPCGPGTTPNGELGPAIAYARCRHHFSAEHEYGRARLRLLDYLIEVTDEQ